MPYRWLFPAIVIFCCIGVYSISNSVFDVWIVLLFGSIDYGLAKLSCNAAPLLLGFILAPMMEENSPPVLLLARRDWSVLVTSPISASFLAIAAILIGLVMLPSIRKGRQEAFVED